MVANMTIGSSHVKQPQHASGKKEPTPPPKYAWLFKTSTSNSAKTDSGSRPAMIHSPEDSSNSWETRAFAEDASSLAAGIWPPRAYPCSFCRREFRSAQALGGHMNVHRRDRARLRHSSPPAPALYGARLTTPQPRSLFQAHEKYTISQTAGYPNESLIKLNSAPITLSKCSNLPVNTPYTSLISDYRSDNPSSFPLRLQQLASEAAASLMCSPPCDTTSDLLSLWPTSIANPISLGGTPMTERTMEVSSSSSWSSGPSSNASSVRPQRTEATPTCGRDPPTLQPEDESPKKKLHTEKNSNPPYKNSIACKNSLKDGLQGHAIQSHPMKTTADDTSYSECGGDIDLELRLG
ncbi:hypothetical protein GOP47_0029598 [Adiantum capillus-veneris]|nr:hypothetical protein GOP47_0029598 [Adiantum capillus-veneris]